MDAMDNLRGRRSVRSFTQDPIPEDVIRDIVDAGRLAATARNDQPWEFVVVTEPGLRSRIAETTDYGKFIAEAPVCVVVLCEDTKYFLEDGSAAAQNILLAAHAKGFGACWVAGDKKSYADTIRKLVAAPDGYRLVCCIALGRPKDVPSPSKRSLDDVLHWETF